MNQLKWIALVATCSSLGLVGPANAQGGRQLLLKNGATQVISFGADVSANVVVSSVKVMGDALADSGAFLSPSTATPYKFTIQGAQSLVYPELVAQAYGINSLCSYYQSADDGATFSLNPQSGCTNYAVGGARINKPGNLALLAAQYSIPAQMAAASASANFSATDLLIVNGGGSDVTDLVRTFLGAANNSAEIPAYRDMLTTLLDPSVVAKQMNSGRMGFAEAGTLYMSALADMFFDAIKVNALGKGAQHVVVLNLSALTHNPRLQQVLDAVSASAGGGISGATLRSQVEGVFKNWVETFNARIASKFADNSNVVLVDTHTALKELVANPNKYGVTNVTQPACPAAGTGADGLPTYNFLTCTDAALSAMPPAGASGGADWWKTYAYSDGVHPTPYGHHLLRQLITKSLTNAGWL